MKLNDFKIDGTATLYEGRWTVCLYSNSSRRAVAATSGIGLTWKVALSRATERLIEELELYESSSD